MRNVPFLARPAGIIEKPDRIIEGLDGDIEGLLITRRVREGLQALSHEQALVTTARCRREPPAAHRKIGHPDPISVTSSGEQEVTDLFRHLQVFIAPEIPIQIGIGPQPATLVRHVFVRFANPGPIVVEIANEAPTFVINAVPIPEWQVFVEQVRAIMIPEFYEIM